MRAILPAMIPIAFACSACAFEPPAPAPVAMPAGDELAAPPEGEGIQLALTTTIEPGVELERCKYFRIPDGGLHVAKKEVRFTSGSHHVLLLGNEPDRDPGDGGSRRHLRLLRAFSVQ